MSLVHKRNELQNTNRLKPNSSKIAHFPNENHWNLTKKPSCFHTNPHTYFSTKFCTTFNFVDVFIDDKQNTCATIIQNSTNHVDTLPTGLIGYIEVPITNGKHKVMISIHWRIM